MYTIIWKCKSRITEIICDCSLWPFRYENVHEILFLAWLGPKLNTKSTTLNYFPTVILTFSIQFLTFGCCCYILAEIVLLRSVFFFPTTDCLAVLNLIRRVQPGGVILAFWRHACNSGVSSDVREPISLHQAVPILKAGIIDKRIYLCVGSPGLWVAFYFLIYFSTYQTHQQSHISLFGLTSPFDVVNKSSSLSLYNSSM